MESTLRCFREEEDPEPCQKYLFLRSRSSPYVYTMLWVKHSWSFCSSAAKKIRTFKAEKRNVNILLRNLLIMPLTWRMKAWALVYRVNKSQWSCQVISECLDYNHLVRQSKLKRNVLWLFTALVGKLSAALNHIWCSENTFHFNGVSLWKRKLDHSSANTMVGC